MVHSVETVPPSLSKFGLEEWSAPFGLSLGGYAYTPRARDQYGRLQQPITLLQFITDSSGINWTHTYVNQSLFETDPVYLACVESTLPVWWDNEGGFVYDRAPLMRVSERAVLKKCQRFTGVRGGISVPVHSCGGGLGYVVFVCERPINELLDMRESVDNELLGAAHRLHAKFRIAVPTTNQVGVTLTRREVECLRLSAEGKTLEEIAQLINLSYSTIRFHLRRAGDKLGALDRVHAVAKASYLGLLGPIQ